MEELESTGTEVTASQETPASAESSPAAAPEVSTSVEASAEVPAFTPNLKFKAADKEHEFEPWAKEVIKDAETEKKIRELHEKAYGLDSIKQHRDSIKEQFGYLSSEHQNLQGMVNQVLDLRDKGDLKSFFESFKIDDDAILKYALKVAELREDPKALAAYEAQRHESQRAYALEQENSTYRSQLENLGIQQRTFELDLVMQKPDISAVAAAYDEKVGRPGAFKAEVVNRGAFHAMTSKKDLPAEQVAREVASMLGWNMQDQQAGNESGVMSSPAAPASPAAKKPVIPNISGRGTSPVQKVPKSLEDLKRMGREMGA